MIVLFIIHIRLIFRVVEYYPLLVTCFRLKPVYQLLPVLRVIDLYRELTHSTDNEQMKHVTKNIKLVSVGTSQIRIERTVILIEKSTLKK